MNRFVLCLVCLLIFVSFKGSARPPKILVISDIEGEFTPFRQLLIGNKVINDHDDWIFGRNKLVICGDLFDRGKQVFEELDFLQTLETKAKASGGQVHVILGNHDIMNMSGDYRYVDSSYKTDLAKYAACINASTALGRWLRSKPLAEKIGNRLFLHGGISPKVNEAGLTLQQINNIARPYYGSTGTNMPESAKLLLGSAGLIWYRGYFMTPRAAAATIDSTCKLFNVKQIVVGHTIVDRNIALYYNGRVLGIDVDAHHGDHQAVLIEGDREYKVDMSGKREALIYKQQNDTIDPQQIR